MTKFKESLSMFCPKNCSEHWSCPLKENRHSPGFLLWRVGAQGTEVRGDRSGMTSGEQSLSGPAVSTSPGNTHWHFRRRVHLLRLTFHKEMPGYLPMQLSKQILPSVVLNHPYFNICNRRYNSSGSRTELQCWKIRLRKQKDREGSSYFNSKRKLTGPSMMLISTSTPIAK